MNITLEFTTLEHSPSAGCSIALLSSQRACEPQGDYVAHCRAYADAAGCAVVSAPYENGGAMEMTLFMDGEEYTQRACFCEGFEKQGDDVSVFETSLGRLALCCGDDIFQPQYARLAALRGAQMLLCSSHRDDETLRLYGPWGAAQANNMAVAFAGALGGELMLPCALTKDNSGRGRLAFDTNEIAAAYAEFPVWDSLNGAFYRRYSGELGQ